MNTEQEITEHEFSKVYDEMLDECYPEIKIGNLKYSVSHVLKEVDPIAYRCGLLDYADSEGVEII